MGSLRFILLPCFLLAVVCFDHAAVLAADEFTYNGFGSAGLTLDGMSVVAPNGLLVLSNGTNQMAGHAFHHQPLRLRDGAGGAVRSFSAAFVFAIVSNFTVLSDNGMAFLVAPSTRLSTFNAGQYLGILNVSDNGKADNRVFFVELDTMLNPEFQDMNSNHLGVNVNSMKSLQNHSAGYYDDATGAFNNLSLISRQPMQVWVDYDGATTQLDVTMAPLGVLKPKKPLISAPVNLSAVVTDTAYIGFSAATGVVYTRHYVLGWSFAVNGAAPLLDTSKLPALPRFGPKPRSKVLEIVLPIATAAFVLALLIGVFLFVRRRMRYAEVREDWEVEFGPHRFSYKELYQATKGFKNKQLLGTGGFGRVYKGVLPKSKLEIAVKRVSHDSKQGMKEFIAEVVSIGHLRHRNLVQLLGYCRRQGELLLVYDYMSNGSLDKYLYDNKKPVLDWDQRFQIIKGIASGLLYLHEDWEKVVIHRDIKASNVLLDGDMNGRLGDFGLARLYDHSVDPQTTHVVGTMGYLAPELLRTGKATPVTDVFSFGVFVLEVTCGRRPLQCIAPDDQNVLLDWVQDHERKGAALDTVDSRLCGKYDADEARMAIKLGLMCAHPLPDARPSMRQVVQYLVGDAPMPEVAPTYVSYTMLALMQNDGFDSFVMSFPSMATSSVRPVSSGFSAVSGLSGGR
ncbi:L-type lectin-domain containing receptor kinase SIT2-like [Phragmites australis]|uniref:L-type lectin-domain containing receptor kinase SIT2-like n=1 Tax=Phragmites australis TaxID=29695 RepID=UPI002D78546A|nr:L-type lectin-domain containing receptor kinase SIT2-like [Phragmites australis]